GVPDRDHGLAREVRHQRELLVGEWADLAAIDGDGADQLVFLRHRHDERCPDAAQFDRSNRHWDTVEGSLLLAHVSELDRLPGPRRSGKRAIWMGTERPAPALRFVCCWPCTVKRSGTKGVSFAQPQRPVTGLAEPRRVREDRLEHGLEISWRTADDAE